MLKLRNIYSILGDCWKVVYSIDKGRENTKNSGSIGIKESVCKFVKDNGRRVLRRHQRQRRCVGIRMTDGIERMIK